jgi:hypothetical protein
MRNRTWKESAFAVPGVGVSILPKVICPLCSPVYAAVLSSLGLGFLVSTTYLLHDSRSLAFLDVGQFDTVHLELLHLHLLGGAMRSGLSGKGNEDGAQQRKRK